MSTNVSLLPAAIELQGVSALHGITRSDPIDLQVSAGERVWLRGPSGIGKTSLLYVMGCLAPPRSGRLVVLGEEVRGEGVARRMRREAISFVLQDSSFVDCWSVEQNVSVAVGRERLARARDQLDTWGVPYRGIGPRNLSGGERQRIALACALVRDSALVIADEPTSSLDRDSRTAVMTAFGQLPLSTTVVISSHDEAWGTWASTSIDLGERVR